MTVDSMIMYVPGEEARDCAITARKAASIAQSLAPKLTGRSASRILPIFGPGWYGVRWLDSYVWFQEHGINAFTMRSLAGKTIPMWLDDPTGKLHRENPKAKTRSMSGRRQVLIFRRAALPGQRKWVKRDNGVMANVPMSYPGAPGRIVRREAPAPFTTPGRVGGQIARGNGGVRWRHPGIMSRGFLHEAMVRAAEIQAFNVDYIHERDSAIPPRAA